MSHAPKTKDSLPEQNADSNRSFTPHKGSALRTALAAVLGAGIGIGGTSMFLEGKNPQSRQDTVDVDGAVARALAERSGEYGSILNRLSDLELHVTLDDLDDAADLIAPSTVRVQGEVEGFYGERVTVTGSGTIIVDNLGRKFILTNAHVTEDSGVDIDGQGNSVYTVTLYNGND